MSNMRRQSFCHFSLEVFMEKDFSLYKSILVKGKDSPRLLLQ